MIFTYWHLWPYAALMILLSVVVLFLNLRQRKKQTKLFKMRSWHQIPLIFWMRHGALSLMIIFLAFAMLRPLGGAEFLKQGERNLDILFVFDVSKSMKAVDMGAAENSEDRLTVGKNLIKAFLEVFKSGRVGLIEFAGEALVVSPLTTDYRVFRHYLEDLSTEDLAISGTNLSESLGLGLQHLEVGGFEDYTKMLVLISDGEETLNADMAFWARQAKEQNIPIFVIGIGSEEGAPIPEGYDDFGRIRYKVYQGETVISRLNESTLKNIAQLSGGIYRRVEDGKALKALIREIDKIPYKIRWKDAEASEKGELYQIFVLLSFISFVLWLFLTDWKPRFKTPLMVGFISLLLGGCTWGSDLQFRYYNHQGVESFKKEDLVSAEELFQTSRNFMVEPSVIPDNQMGLIYYAREDYKKARNIWEKATSVCAEKSLPYCDEVYYHLGNAWYRLSEKEDCLEQKKPLLEEAFKAYNQAFTLNNQEEAIRHNLSLVESMLLDPPPDKCKGQEPPPEEEPPPEDPPPKDSPNGDPEAENQEAPQEESQEPANPEDDEQGKDEAPQEPSFEDQLAEYEAQMEQVQDEARSGFSRRPGKNSPSYPFFGDPFFEQFFGGQGEAASGKPNQEGEGTSILDIEKDW